MPEPPSPHLLIDAADAVTVARFLDPQITDPAVIAELRRQLYELLDRGQNRLLLCFADVELLVTEMLGVLIGVKRKVEAADGRLVLCGFQPLPRQAMRITGLDQIFQIADDEETGRAAFG